MHLLSTKKSPSTFCDRLWRVEEATVTLADAFRPVFRVGDGTGHADLYFGKDEAIPLLLLLPEVEILCNVSGE